LALELPDYDLSPEQLEFRDTLRRFFEEFSPMTEVRVVMASESDVSRALWKQICEELGLPGLAIGEECGGQGFGLKELSIALGETGRALAPAPLFAVAGLTARAIAALTSGAERDAWLGPIATGMLGTLAWVESSGHWTVDATTTEVHPDGSLSGEKCFVLNADLAERFFVVAREPGSQGEQGLGLYAVEAGAPGLSSCPVESLDPTRRLATLRLDRAPARAVGEPHAAGPGLKLALEEATALHCAEMLGGMQKVLETAVDYANTRYQFSRPIGSFQAIKHKAADMLIDFEGARTATAAAIDAVDTQDAESSLLISVAKAHTGPAYLRMATENIQIHGGVGYTWEYDAHLHFRRAHSSAILLGDASWHQERLARTLAAQLGGVEQS
jgi:alkylation response protein AidB-like acyl-CoA dehydrogenase